MMMRVRARVVIQVCCVALLSGACRPRPPVHYDREAWSYGRHSGLRLTTEHFDIFTTLPGDALNAALPAFLESAYARYVELLPPPGLKPGARTTVTETGLKPGTRTAVTDTGLKRIPVSYSQSTDLHRASDDETPPGLKPGARTAAPDTGLKPGARTRESGNAVAPARLTTYAFGTRDEWDRYARTHYPARHDIYARIRSGGFTEGTTSVIFFKAPSTTLATLAHEGWHQYVAGFPCSPLPAWLNEGLAATCETFEFDRGRPRFFSGNNTFRVRFLREALTSGPLLTLGELVDADAGAVLVRDDSRLTQAYYAQLWALIAYLRDGDNPRHRAAFDRMMVDLARGTMHIRAGATRLAQPDPSSVTYGRAVFETYFGDTDGPVAEDYRRYLNVLARVR